MGHTFGNRDGFYSGAEGITSPGNKYFFLLGYLTALRSLLYIKVIHGTGSSDAETAFVGKAPIYGLACFPGGDFMLGQGLRQIACANILETDGNQVGIRGELQVQCANQTGRTGRAEDSVLYKAAI